MALTTYTEATNIIGSLGTTPEDRPGMTDQQLKDKFDENAGNLKTFVNALTAELASTASGKGASCIGVQDSAGRFTAADVEAVLAEIAGSGRTTESLKSLTDSIGVVSGNLTTHQADLITDSDGVHGLKIESGTWTPTVRGASVAGSNTYTARSGSYRKIGDIVIASFYIVMSTKDAAMSGNARIGGLPFTVANVGSEQFAFEFGYYANLTGVSAGSVGGALSSNQVMAEILNRQPTSINALTAANITASTYLIGHMVYKTQ